MKASIEFTIYQDYSCYLKKENDYNYTDALGALNEHLKDLVSNKKLTFKYNNKIVHPVLPISEHCVGNIFGEDDYDGPNWEGIAIECEIDIDEFNFDPKKFKVDKHPYYFNPRAILY